MGFTLVTGGAGFIGSNLVEALEEEGREICIIDDLSTGSRDNLEDTHGFIAHSDIKAIEQSDVGIDTIYHLGIPSSSPMYKEDRSLVASAIDDFIYIMELARENDSKVIFASSSSVYGQEEPPHKEDMILTPFDYYTEARITMERLGKVYHNLYDIEVFPMRFFSVYGPHEQAKGEYANMVTQMYWWMREDKRPVLFGDGSQTRDFTYVRDVVRALLLVEEEAEGYDIFNIGTGMETSFNDLIDLLNLYLDKDIQPEYRENPIDNYVQRIRASNIKIFESIGWGPEVFLEEGIERMVNDET